VGYGNKVSSPEDTHCFLFGDLGTGKQGLIKEGILKAVNVVDSDWMISARRLLVEAARGDKNKGASEYEV
jgi:hypothetical protein